MIRRVFILTTESPEQGGGMEHFVRELAKGLTGNGYLVQIFHQENCMPAGLRSPSNRFAIYAANALLGLYVGRCAEKSLNEEVAAVISNSTAGWYRLKALPTTTKNLHFCHGTYRGQAEAGRPVISRRGYLKMKWWDSMVLERAGCRGKLVLCNSDQTRDEVKRFFGYDSVTVWCPLDTLHFRPMERSTCRAAIDLSGHHLVGLFVGSIQPLKNFALARELINTLPEIGWILALRGEVPAEFMGNPHVRVFQNASFELLPLLYGAADFSVCPSLSEPFGLVVAESLACGTPVIASPGGASRLFLREKPLDRLLIPDPNSTEKFRSAICEIASDPAYFRRVILERVRPQLEELMAPANWFRRFCKIASL
jgi:glycosyltransferase involved in cell wall biosynthesis